MNLYSINTGTFKLDGGAMFGVVPKVLWERTNPADDRNQIDMAMRCLLIETGDRLVLVDTGIGHKYDEKFGRLYAIDHSTTLEDSLKQAGFAPSDVTEVLLTHLHFDHCGGNTFRNPESGEIEPFFKNARYHVQKSHLQWALEPNAREKASFFKENILPVIESGQLNEIDGETELLPGVQLLVVNGHTEAQQLPLIDYKGKKILFAADLFPTFGHLPLPYVMGYDVRPIITLEEREHFLPWCVENEIVLMYEHDPYYECGTVAMDERGKFSSGETFKLSEI